MIEQCDNEGVKVCYCHDMIKSQCSILCQNYS
jgi:hypothetical protein